MKTETENIRCMNYQSKWQYLEIKQQFEKHYKPIRAFLVANTPRAHGDHIDAGGFCKTNLEMFQICVEILFILINNSFILFLDLNLHLFIIDLFNSNHLSEWF